MKRYFYFVILILFAIIFPLNTYAAISLDGTSSGVNLGGSSISVSHTITSTNSTILLVGISGSSNADNISSVTYNGDSLTLIKKHTSGGSWVWLYGLLNPDIGTHDISVSLGTAQDLRVVAISYSGVEQSLTFDSIGDKQNTDDPSTSLTSTATTTAENAQMVVLGGFQRNPLAGTNSTQRVKADNALAFFDFNGTIADPGSYSMTYTYSSCGANCMSSIFATLAPAVATSTQTNCVSNVSPAICGSAISGSVAMPTGTNTLTVNTTAVTANSQIFVMEDSSLGSLLSLTCNTSQGRTYTISSRVASSSFTIKSSNNPVTRKACLSYFIVN